MTKRVCSISLGSSQRNKSTNVEWLGEKFEISRVGTDGDRKKFAQLFSDLDGKVHAFGVGGADIYVAVADKKYRFRSVLSLVKAAKITPVVDGSGLKHTLEREAIRLLQESGEVDFAKEKVLLVSAVDRYGMAQALSDLCPNVIYGDLLFGLGVDKPLRSYKQVKQIGSLLLPIVTQLPIQWFYPTGSKQENRAPRHEKYFNESSFIAGDWHYIRRYAPDRLDGKTILTQTIRKQDLEWLKSTGAKRVITTTPVIEGETFATNVMEAVIIAHLERRPELVTEQDYLNVLKQLSWKPNVIQLD
jgi:hypothetical protein